MKKLTDSELLRIIFPAPGQPVRDLERGWTEFIIRCLAIVTRTTSEVYTVYRPKEPPNSEDNFAIMEIVIINLYQDNFQDIKKFIGNNDFRLEHIIVPKTISAVLDHIGNKRGN